jgi:DNA-binding NarL/FixJ family response regulator
MHRNAPALLHRDGDGRDRNGYRTMGRGWDRQATCKTPRERQVFREAALGRVNKQIAFSLGISQITVKLHPSDMMRKMEATSVGELIRAWEALAEDPRRKRPEGATA